MIHPHSHPCTACTDPQAFCSLAGEIHDAFEALKTNVTVAKGAVVFDEGEPSHSVFVVCEGSVKLVMSSKEGRVLLLRSVVPGDLLGLSEAVLGQTTYRSSAIATEPSSLGMIPRETFMRFLGSYPDACLKIVSALSEQYKVAQRETKFLAFGGTSTARLAHLLVEQARAGGHDLADGLHVPFHTTHAELAQSIGSTRETVTRVLGYLSQSGIIERGTDEVIIHDAAELARLSAY